MQSTISKEIKDRGKVFCACSTAIYRLEDSNFDTFIAIYMLIYGNYFCKFVSKSSSFVGPCFHFKCEKVKEVSRIEYSYL